MFLESGDAFLSEMSKMFERSRNEGGSVLIAMKRVDSSKKPTPRPAKQAKLAKKESEPVTNHCLIRCTFKHQKISTNIDAGNIHKFQSAYSNLLRGNFYGLKDQKQVKKKQDPASKKGKATQ